MSCLSKFRISVIAGIISLATLSFNMGTSYASTSIKPVVPSLASHSLIQQFTGKQLSSAPWTNPSNDPGNCPVNPAQITDLNGNATLSTNGDVGNCTSSQSPSLLPTNSGYVYEARFEITNFGNWPAIWMYGANWPQDGEIDAVEINIGANYVTWHYGDNNSTIGTGSWNGQVVSPTSPNIKPNVWETVDILFGSDDIQIFYNGIHYVSIPQNLTPAGKDPMYFTLSEGSCEAEGGNVCVNGSQGVDSPGKMLVNYIREFK